MQNITVKEITASTYCSASESLGWIRNRFDSRLQCALNEIQKHMIIMLIELITWYNSLVARRSMEMDTPSLSTQWPTTKTDTSAFEEKINKYYFEMNEENQKLLLCSTFNIFFFHTIFAQEIHETS